MLVFKIITSITADKIYGHLDQPYLLEQEHKGCKKRSRGTTDFFILIKQLVEKFKELSNCTNGL